MSFPKLIAGALLAGTLGAAGLALAQSDTLPAPIDSLRLAASDYGGAKDTTAPSGMKSMSEIMRQLEAKGYGEFREIEREGGRYEVKARDRDGRWREIYVDGRSGEIVKVEDD